MRKYSLIFLTLALSACATITASAEQDITVTTTPAGATCTLTNGQESWTLDQTPGGVTLPRAFQPIMVTCKLDGYTTQSQTLEAKTRGRAYGNILLLGIPTLVDASTGAGYEYEPSEVILTLQLVTASAK